MFKQPPPLFAKGVGGRKNHQKVFKEGKQSKVGKLLTLMLTLRGITGTFKHQKNGADGADANFPQFSGYRKTQYELIPSSSVRINTQCINIHL